MSVSQNYPFNSALDFNLSNVEIVSNAARLSIVQLTGQTFTQSFDSSTGFTFDSTKAEFVSGMVRQKDQRPAGALLYSKFDSKDANWASGSIIGTLNGGASISGGKLLVTNANDSRIQYEGTSNMPSGNKGCVRFTFKPNYSGAPSGNAYLFASSQAENNIANMVRLFHTGLTIRIDIYNSAGASILTSQTGNTFNPVAGQTYEFEFNWDADVGEHRLFIDGVLINGVKAGTGTLGARGIIRLGDDYTESSSAGANGDYDNLTIYSSPQHSANYTPGSIILPDYIYATTKVDGPNFTYTGIGTVQSVDSASVTEAGTPRYIIEGKYWNGSAWVASSGAYSQANALATVLANLSALNVVGETTISFSVVFDNAATLSSVDSMTLTYTGQKYSATGYLEPVVALNVRELLTYVQTQTEPGSTSIKLILKIDGVLKYWNGSAWVVSDGTGSQANTASQFNSNLSNLDLGANSAIYIRWLLETSLDTATPLLDDATIEYEFGAIEIEADTCIVYGYYKDIANNPVSGAQVRFTLVKADGQYSEAQNNIIEKNVTLTTDANGYFSTPLIRTSEYQNGGTYKVTITKTADQLSTAVNANNQDLTFQVPDTTTKDITDLLPPA